MRQFNKSLILVLCCLSLFSSNTLQAQGGKTLKTIIIDAGHGGSDPGARAYYENCLCSNEKTVTLNVALALVKELKKRLPDLNIVPTRTSDFTQTVGEKAQFANDNNGDLFISIHADSRELKTGKRQVGTKTVTKYEIRYVGKGKKRKKISEPYEIEVPIYETFKIPTTITGTSVYLFAPHKTASKINAVTINEADIDIVEASDSTITSRFDVSTPEGKQLALMYAKKYFEKSNLLANFIDQQLAVYNRVSQGVHQRQTGIRVLEATNMPAILVETGYINTPEDERYLNSEAGQKELANIIADAVIKYKQVVYDKKPTQ